jgi:hypothetical protein
MELEEADANVALDSEVAFCFSPRAIEKKMDSSARVGWFTLSLCAQDLRDAAQTTLFGSSS